MQTGETMALEPEASSSTSESSSTSAADEMLKDVNVPVNILPRVDERCFTYCTQRSNTRTFQVEPACHTICWRKVWNYERTLINAASREGFVHLNVPPPAGVTREEDKEALHDRFADERERLHALDKRRKRPTADEEKERAFEERHLSFINALNTLAMQVKSTGQEDKAQFIHGLSAKVHGNSDKWFSSSRFGKWTGRWIHPFPPPNTDRWNWFRGHFIYYARGPSRAKEHMGSMQHLGLGEDWKADGALAVRDIGEKRGNESRAVGLRELQGEEAGLLGKEDIRDPNYAVLISLEHLPPMVYDSIINSFQRIYNPVVSLLERYRASFASGQQRRTAGMLWQTAWDPEEGPLGTLKKLGAAFERRRKEEEREREEREGKKGGGL
ncbi:hypothetical protein CALVIDRAFT_598483 [Calocera viscosa TUFC12733]|uniref:Uncharacterized protein n=1 Tax=Calocera viscosa (strain TUFC12733) TaxID=1330018 RepID=A0A167LY51_CALVF|nr:hypothetical protein CALVIDRAFT_598483 [Calocera viscosa TUFC12733]